MAIHIDTVDVRSASIESFRPLLEPQRRSELEEAMKALADSLRRRVLWNINSTAHGGGVVELLSSLIPYDRGSGIDERWAVIEGPPEFFALTKRLHNLLHGETPDGTEISERERELYEKTMRENAARLLRMIKPEDVVIVHDPQPAGLVPALMEHGACVIWRCHIGVDKPNDVARAGWRFLLPYVKPARAFVFSRRCYAWEGLDESRLHVIAPTIDPFSPKNRDLSGDEVASILRAARLAPRKPDARLVVQVSRWDRLKDPLGVMEAFARFVAPATDAMLMLAGPAASAVDDDPEQPMVLKSVTEGLAGLPAEIRERVMIAQLPMEDVERNALMVNAIQRRADVVVQKSLAEGFGLTVAEAMWKSRPMVASRVGGIEDQVEDGVSGLLIDDPRDLHAFGDAVAALVQDRDRAESFGRAARRRVTDEFIAPRHLVQQARLILGLLA